MALSLWNDDFFMRPFETSLLGHSRPGSNQISNMNRDLMPLMATDLSENENSYSVHCDLPGVNPEDLEVTCEENCLCMKAERKYTHEENSSRFHSRERAYGKVSRRIYLPKDANMDGCETHFRNGVLSIIIPKKNMKGMSRKLNIMHGENISSQQHGGSGGLGGGHHKWEIKAHFKNPKSLHQKGFCTWKVPNNFSSSRETEFQLPGGETIVFMVPSGCRPGDELIIEFDKEWDKDVLSSSSSAVGKFHHGEATHGSHNIRQQPTSGDKHKWEVKGHFKNPRALRQHGFCTYRVPVGFSTSRETEFVLPGGESILFNIPEGCQVGDEIVIEFDKELK